MAALAAAACVGIGIGIGAAIWQGDDAPAAPAAALPTKGTSSWLFVVRAASGSVTATGGDDLTIVLRGVPPTALAFTDRPALQAAALSTSAVGAALAPDAAGYADGAIAPLNAALTFAFEGAPVALPVTILDVARAGRNYTLTARAMPAEGGGAVAVQGGAAVRETSSPLWAALRAGLELEAPAMFIDDVEAPSAAPPPSPPSPPGPSPPGPDYDYGEPPPWTCTTADPTCVPTDPNPYCNDCFCDPGNPDCSRCPNACNCETATCVCNNMCVVSPSAPTCCCSCDAGTCGTPGNKPCCEPCTGSDEYPCCCTEPGCTQQYDWAPTPPPPPPSPCAPGCGDSLPCYVGCTATSCATGCGTFPECYAGCLETCGWNMNTCCPGTGYFSAAYNGTNNPTPPPGLWSGGCLPLTCSAGTSSVCNNCPGSTNQCCTFTCE